jgi:hypothetical protein
MIPASLRALDSGWAARRKPQSWPELRRDLQRRGPPEAGVRGSRGIVQRFPGVVLQAMRHESEPMDLPSRPGANRRRTRRHGEDLQRHHAGKDTVACASCLATPH